MTAHAVHTPFPFPFTPLRLMAKPKLSVDDIYPALFDAILEQRIVPASRFTEESLAQDFGVSRSVIRRVLARLSQQQVIILRPNHRAQVAAPNAQDIRQILEARRLTEGTVVQLACARAKSACSGHLSIVYIAEDQQWIYADGEKLIDFLGTSSDLQSNLKLRMFAASDFVEYFIGFDSLA